MRKILLGVIGLILLSIIVYFSFAGYVLYLFSAGCGTDDGPFRAQPVNAKPTGDSLTFIVHEGILTLHNGSDHSPVFSFIKAGKVQWRIEMDVSKNKGYESCRLWEVSDVEIISDSDPFTINFTGHWTYGAERGYLEIDRDSGKNSFCLSW